MSKHISEPSSCPSIQPLTLDELKQMEGRPVWVKVIDHSVFKDPKDDFDGWGMVRKSWVRIWDEKRADLIHIDYDFESYEKEWLAYATPVKLEIENTQCKDCVSSGRNKDGVLICQNQLCPCYNREVFPKFSCICGESRANYIPEGGNTDV